MGGKSSQGGVEKSENNAYLQHLASVNKSNPVIATQDILNNEGALLLKQGSMLSEQATENLLKFKLLKPIEESIGLKNSFTGESLYIQILTFCEQNTIQQTLYQSCKIDDTLREMCLSVEQYPILIQKLTVHSLQRPEEFNKALSCAWMSLYIGNETGLSQSQSSALFFAALTHDIGMLHIDPLITEKKGVLSAEEWRSVQCHVVIGEKIMHGLGLPSSCCRAILEHHERCDGSGYPRGINSQHLSLEGQIIAMCDMIVAVIQNRLNKKGRGAADLIPILQINNEVHFYKVYDTAVRWIRSVTKDDPFPQRTQQEVDDSIKQVKSRRREIVDSIDIVTEVLRAASDVSDNKVFQSITTCKEQLDRVLNGSGILYSYYVKRLEQGAKCSDTDFVKEIEDSLLMLDESKWRLRHIERKLQLFCDYDNSVSLGAKQAIKLGLMQLKDY